MINGELNGPCAHDGMRFQVPENVIALVLITRSPDGHTQASLSVPRQLDGDVLADVLTDLVLELAGPGAA